MKINSENLQRIPSVKENLQRIGKYKSAKQLVQEFTSATKKRTKTNIERGITRQQFHAILDKAAQPIKESDSGTA